MAKTMKGIGAITRLTRIVPRYSLLKIHKSFLRPHPDYNGVLYDHPNNSLLWFDLMTRDSYFWILVEVFRNYILAENTYFMNHIERTERKIIVLKPANKYQIIQRGHNFKNILVDDFQHHSFLY